MRIKADSPWKSHTYHEGLVNIGTHSLWASTSGPVRQPDDPLIIFFTGGAAPAAEYVKLQEKISSFARTLFYNRAGYDRSTFPPGNDRIHAVDTARDLTKLLAVTHLEPPYVLVGHSFGGIPVRTFFEAHKENPKVVVGIVLLDTATELMLALIPRIPPRELEAVGRNVDWEALTDLKKQSGMTDEQWNYALEAAGRCTDAIKREDTHGSAHQLASMLQIDKQAMGDRPLSVVRYNMAKDHQMLYDAGVKNGDGTEEERRVARHFIETWRLYDDQLGRAQCRLSKDTTFVAYDEWGHDAPMRYPAAAAEEVRKMLVRVRKSRGT
jgi:pimeloyl-ACP methyl ester carboxylesterase